MCGLESDGCCADSIDESEEVVGRRDVEKEQEVLFMEQISASSTADDHH